MIVVVGGHSRNIGKTAVAEAILRALPAGCFTAVKITQFGHGVCSAGETCDCATGDAHPYALTRTTEPDFTDTGRFLAAGAVASYWLRTRQGELAEAMPALRKLLAEAGNVIIESNTVLNFLVPDLYIVVLDYAVADMKESARRFLGRADALVVLHGDGPAPAQWNVPERWLTGKPRFNVAAPSFFSPELAAWLGAAAAKAAR